MSRNNQTLTKTPFYQKIASVIFGLFLTIVILEIGLRLGGFVLLSIQEHRNRISVSKRGSYRIMCLGESTTAGQYPPFLEEMLNQRNIGIKFSVIDKGIVGTTTAAILSKLESDLDTYHPDMVITMMGSNDFGPHMPYEAISDSKAINFLKSFRTYKLARLLWLHIVARLKDSNQLLLQRIELQQIHAENKDVLPSEALLKFKKAIELNPKNDYAYVGLGKSYRGQGKSFEAEELLKKAIELDPKNDWAYVELGKSYRGRGKPLEAEGLYKKAIELDPKNDCAYVGLGSFYRGQGKYLEAEELLKKAIELSPKNDEAYIELGKSYRGRGKFSEAEESFKKAIELDPKNDWAYVELGNSYRDQDKSLEAEESFKKAIELDPKNDWAYVELGKSYRGRGKFSEAEESFKKAIELNPKNDEAYIELGNSYLRQGKPLEAEELLKKAIELNLRSDIIYGALEILCSEMGNPGLAREYGKKAKEIRLGYYRPNTTGNYHKLKAALDKRGIAYVCVQYPMRNLGPLEKIFQGNAEGIIFVDNEKIFKDALKKTSHREYFSDMFGGDFGHCTEKGNRLLAENIANTILKEVFNK